MTYTELKKYFTFFHIGEITKIELIGAIFLWQETLKSSMIESPFIISCKLKLF